jgi:hypothetical protein
MRMPIARTIVALAGATTIAVGGAAYAASGHHAAHSGPAGVKTNTTAAPEPTSPDTDNIQSGDQTAPDNGTSARSSTGVSSQGGSETAATGEQAGESGGGSEVTSNDGPGGHADEPGNPNADHQFQGQE